MLFSGFGVRNLLRLTNILTLEGHPERSARRAFRRAGFAGSPTIPVFGPCWGRDRGGRGVEEPVLSEVEGIYVFASTACALTENA